jgi:hypothetical protein
MSRVTTAPASDEVAGAFGLFFHAGIGPSHSALTGVFQRSGYSDADSYVPGDPDGPNKETRVQSVVRAAARRPARARDLIEGLLTTLRVAGCFKATSDDARGRVQTLQAALRRAGWSLSDDGALSPIGTIDLDTGGRDALDEQLARLRGATSDPSLLLGSAKDLLEAVAKFVIEELGGTAPKDFNQLWYLARDRLGVHPTQVVPNTAGSEQVRSILQASWTIAEQVNQLRNLQGTGHGRTLPTAMSPEMAMLVVREACSLAQFMLSTLDSVIGRQ